MFVLATWLPFIRIHLQPFGALGDRMGLKFDLVQVYALKLLLSVRDMMSGCSIIVLH